MMNQIVNSTSPLPIGLDSTFMNLPVTARAISPRPPITNSGLMERTPGISSGSPVNTANRNNTRTGKIMLRTESGRRCSLAFTGLTPGICCCNVALKGASLAAGEPLPNGQVGESIMIIPRGVGVKVGSQGFASALVPNRQTAHWWPLPNYEDRLPPERIPDPGSHVSPAAGSPLFAGAWPLGYSNCFHPPARRPALPAIFRRTGRSHLDLVHPGKRTHGAPVEPTWSPWLPGRDCTSGVF